MLEAPSASLSIVLKKPTRSGTRRHVPRALSTPPMRPYHPAAVFSALAIVAVLSFACTDSKDTTNWYVDNAVARSGDGKTWTTAWKSFSDIDWRTIKPGHTLYISGGSAEQTYFETLMVRASGAPNRPVTVTRGIDPGHNGTVIIDGQNRRSDGVMIGDDETPQNHVHVAHLTAQNFADGAGFHVRSSTDGVVIEDNSIYTGSGDNLNPSRGIDVRRSTNAIIRSNTVNTPERTTAQTDGIWSSENTNISIDGNIIIISNVNSTGHSDAIQSFNDMTIIIRNNFLSHPNGGVNNHAMWLSDSPGTLTVYNNVVYMPKRDEQAITYWNEPGYTGKALVYNNTVFGSASCYRFIDAPNSELKNNICARPARAGVVIDGTLSKANIDYNLIWPLNGFPGTVAGHAKTWVEWQAFGYDTHGVNGDPHFKDATRKDFTLQANSPGIDAGATISLFATDKNGTPRPLNRAYDIGAYEADLPSP